MRLIVDTNIIISSIIKAGKTRQILFDFNFEFFTPAFTLTEIRKYTDEICKKGKIDLADFENYLKIIFKYVTIISPEKYFDLFSEADILIKDKKDIPFISCALALKCGLWSNDKGFREQKIVKVYTTQNLLDKFNI